MLLHYFIYHITIVVVVAAAYCEAFCHGRNAELLHHVTRWPQRQQVRSLARPLSFTQLQHDVRRYRLIAAAELTRRRLTTETAETNRLPKVETAFGVASMGMRERARVTR